MDIIATLPLADHNGLNIRFNALPEDLPLDREFYEREIESGKQVYFCAQVTASKNGIELAAEYLGNCLYNDYIDLIVDGDYIDDMISDVTAQGAQNIIELSK